MNAPATGGAASAAKLDTGEREARAREIDYGQAIACLAQADVVMLVAELLRPGGQGDRQWPANATLSALLGAAGFGRADAWERWFASCVSDLEARGAGTVSEQHCSLFDGPTLCPINETAYVRRDKGAILADVAGFYRAFGFGLRAAAGEKADHMVTELEFVAVLLAMLANALQQGHTERADTCGAALRAFAAHHLGAWLLSFCARLEAVAGLDYHRAAARLLRLTWLELCAVHGLERAAELLEPAPASDEPFACGAAPGSMT